MAHTQPFKGLTTEQASRRLERHGENALPDTGSRSLLARFLDQFRSPLIYILLFALLFDTISWCLEGFVGFPTESLTILVILVFNAGLGIWQESKSEQALARLKDMASPMCWVYRDGELRRLSSKLIVPGDVVRVEAGDRIPADGQVLDQNSFSVDESVLTGESLPVEKTCGEPAFSGTLVVRGRALVEVQSTGSDSNMGKLAHLLGSVEAHDTPLQIKLDAFGRKVALVVSLLSLAVLVGGVGFLGWSEFGGIFLFAVALAVAAVPESLPAVMTLAMALGVERMVGRKAIVRKLTAVEALGSVTVIATDKTGTLTENRMQVAEVDTPDAEKALMAMALVNDADPDSGAGDPLETGLYEYVRSQEQNPAQIRQTFPRIDEKPFDSRWKYMRVTTDQEGQSVSFFKGAPDVLMERCVFDGDSRQYWSQRLEHYASEGYRALALAWGQGIGEENLQWLGLVLLWDPPRPEVPEAIAAAQRSGIRVMMITGDHPLTAATIAGRIGIPKGKVLTGAEIDQVEDEQLRSELNQCSVFARVSPEHKLRLVKLLRESGEIVAVTGDGVNDAPALKAADIGVAMGQRGSDVSREVADLVLQDDNFSTIVSAIEEGRSIYENIQKFIRTLFSANLAEVILITLGAFIAFRQGLVGGELLLPLTAAQILWMNLLTDSLPALALTADQNPHVMHMKPRSPSTPLLDRPTLQFVVSAGLIGGLCSLAMFQFLPQSGMPVEQVQTVVFCYLVWVQLLFVLPARRLVLTGKFSPLVWSAILVASGAQLLLFFIPGLRHLLQVVPVGAEALQWLGGLLVLSYGASEAITWTIRRKMSATV